MTFGVCAGSRRSALLLLGVLLIGAPGVAAQRLTRPARDVGPTRLGLYGGAAIATMSGDGVLAQESRKGMQGGLYLLLPFTENFGLRTGLSYVQKGLTDSLALASGVFRIGYVEMPFIFRMMALPGDDVTLHALAGFVLGFKASCAFRVDSIGTGTVYDGACGQSRRAASFDVNGTDNSAIFGLDLTFAAHSRLSYQVAGTWELGLNNVDPEVTPFAAKNRTIGITLGLIYSLSER